MMSVAQGSLLVALSLLVSGSVGHGFALRTTLHMSNGGASSSIYNEKLVLVTGASRGIGKATCLLLASRGYNVAVNYKSNQAEAQAVVDAIHAQSPGIKAMAFQADVSEPDQVIRMFDKVFEGFGKNPTGLVNNAGVMERMTKDIVEVSFSTLKDDLATNTFGAFFCTREFVKRASTNRGGKGGTIVHVSSVSAEDGIPIAYAMSKAATEAMTRGISKTLPLEGIRINTVVPGLTDTDMAGSPEQVELLSGYIPMRRAGQPSEVANAIEYFLSDASMYCSGAKLRVSGGL